MQVIGIIPARYASSRFPGKPLIDLGGKTMIQRVYEQCLQSKHLNKIVVATDDKRIQKEVESFKGLVIMTSPDHLSGTDRIAEATHLLGKADIIINIQGDEPFIDPNLIDAIIEPLLNDQAEISTAATIIKDHDSIFDPNKVKVVFNKDQIALYFSRSPIPHLRNTPRSLWLKKGRFYKHIGIYGFKRNILLEITQSTASSLELQESLEQLRWLESGKSIYVHLTDKDSIGIDTPEDLENISF